MKRIAVLLCTLLAFCFTAARAEPRASTDEAQSMLRKAVAYYKANGRDKALKEFMRTDGPFVDRDLYITAYAFDGTSLAHINPRFVGKNMIDLRDESGKYHIKERIELARSKGTGYQDLAGRFNPVTHKAENKRMYFQRVDDIVLACGAYKAD